MKKYLFVICAAVVAIVACKKEIQPSNVCFEETVMLTFQSERPQLDASTRTAWDGSKIVWTANDKIRVGYTLDGSWMGQSAAGTAKFYASDFVMIDEGNESIGTFCVPVSANSFTNPGTTGSYQFFAVYPSSAFDGTTVSDPTDHTISLLDSQNPGEGTFDSRADIMVGKSAASNLSGLPSDPISLTWKRLVAHADITFSNLAFDGEETVSKITLTFNEEAKVAGSVSINVPEGSAGAGSKNELVLEGSGIVSGTNSAEVWACVLPVTFTSLNVEVKTDKATYTRSITGISKTFKQNARNTLTVNMTNATRTAIAPIVYSLYSGDLTEGDYLIVYDGQAMKASVSDGRLGYSDVTVLDNLISTNDNSIVWHIAPSGEYWTIFNAEIEQYAASTGVKNKGQLLTDGTNDMSLWTVSGSSTYEFVNKKNKANNVNSNLRYNSGYGFACYATSTGGALSLYKLADMTPRFSVESPFSVSASEDSYTINVTRTNFNGAITITVPEGCEWLVADEAVAENANSFEILVSANDGTESRSVTLTLSGDGVESQTLDVEQEGLVPGTEARPYTVEEALAVIDGLESGAKTPTEVYISGIISQSSGSGYDVTGGLALNYLISDDGSLNNELYIYKGLGLNGSPFIDFNVIAKGDKVVITEEDMKGFETAMNQGKLRKV